jgi:diguanylate cyclase (GGDEF)-like protein/PAS domain S-box-containing protein
LSFDQSAFVLHQKAASSSQQGKVVETLLEHSMDLSEPVTGQPTPVIAKPHHVDSTHSLLNTHDSNRGDVNHALSTAILNCADLTIISTDLDGIIRTCNQSALHRLGYDASEVLHRVTPALIHDPVEVAQRAKVLSEELGHRVEPGFEAFVAKARLGIPDENDWTYICKDGSRFTVRLTVTTLFDRSGNLIGFLGVGKDVSQQRDAERALRETKLRFESFMNNTPAMAYIKDANGKMLYANEQLKTTFEITDAELLGKTDTELWGQDVGATLHEHDKMILQANKQIRFEETVPTPDGTERTWLSFKFPIPTEDGDNLLAGLSIDITDQKYYQDQLEEHQERLQEAVAKLERISQTDSLTNLTNRGEFDRRLRDEIARAQRYQLPMSLVMIDIDAFKMYNDTFGHPAGDAALVDVAELLRHYARTSDVVARVGGEEFAIIMPTTPLQGAYLASERLRKGIQDHSWTQRPVTISVGIAELNTNAEDAESIMQSADQALYRSKKAGGNRATVTSDRD